MDLWTTSISWQKANTTRGNPAVAVIKSKIKSIDLNVDIGSCSGVFRVT
jgi:hypothetical protein